MTIREGAPLAPLTTFRIGGPADVYLEAENEADVRAACEESARRALPLAILGGGSNVLIPDDGVRAVVVRFLPAGITFAARGSGMLATAEAGASWDALVAHAVERGLWGVENLSGIPGTVGGAVVQNVGAYGAVLSDALVSAEAFDTRAGTLRTFAKEECAFGYRTSLFKREPGRYLLMRATFALAREPRPNLSYRDLAERFSDAPDPALAQVRAAVLAIRAGKFPDLSRYGTAGSFFLNPVLPERGAQALAARFPGMPLFPMPEGGTKVPIAWLLDHRHGVMDVRDARSGKAFVWPAQPLVLATEAGATFADVDALANEIASRVHDATGIALTREVIAFDAMRA
ncbi:MAG TPA: UDP-N-acetylmuramate dehydrogenase [Candidatus Paceibacterota bacterium]|nr:UDP-N-acetylmuramate dehydrogenase [Candidatus Paceibacterota bacterium]